MGHALVVDDDADSAHVLAALVSREGHSVSTAGDIASAKRCVAMQAPDLLLLDLHLPDGSGFELLQQSDLLGDTEIVLITGQASVETSIQALRIGAADYLVKPVNPQHLKGLLSRLLRPSALRRELDRITEQWRETGRFGQLIGQSEPMQKVYQQIARVAGTSVAVFVHGESGTGKELVARAVHDLSRRREQPFLAVNCGALSPHLIESEIFGHEKGSFTGADRQHRGFFERAHGGTLFLDEVTEMPPELQVKLLRVLETGTFMRVGSNDVQQTDVRVIAATNRDAHQAVARGVLREDLLYRLNVFPIGLPPLRERGEDVLLLADDFLRQLQEQEDTADLKRLTEDARRRLLAHTWPGNVRELRNAIQRAWVMAVGSTVNEEWLPQPAAADARHTAAPSVQAARDDHADGAPSLAIPVGTPLSEIERRVILATFEHCKHHKERTAAMLGISMKTLYNKLKDYQREPD
ncbi:sigma-54 dependent transcriptional regulator [uncultured Variovorax sp.]|uniref:sigma-54-dependent transcriptional regulator n=1 Tax=uncultured Variovorax sp. TaxID=114708 RepID=UPI0025DAD865|nr:sigma-54 dependent transcriptional regulator [uncultured Variovorax sp.]